MSWNGYWDEYGEAWSKRINKLNISPDEIVIVSDVKVDTSLLKHSNVKNIIVDNLIHKNHSSYRNIAINNSSCDWVVGADIDDHPLLNYLDDLDDSSDIHAFAYYEDGKLFCANENSLKNKLLGVHDEMSAIPSSSAIKRSVFNRLRYEQGVHEDRVFYATCYILNLKASNDPRPRFIYSGWSALSNTSKIYPSSIYCDVLSNKRSLYVFWFSRRLTKNRRLALKTMQQECGVEIRLINNQNFFSYENSEIPIHEGFKYLSDVHKSAYARAYIMYFYGQGYSDIKQNTFDWNKHFDELFTSKYDAIGYPEKSPDSIAKFYQDDSLAEKYVNESYFNFAGNGHYIFKPRTITAKFWLEKLHELLDDKMPYLKNNPGTYHPYAIFGGIHSSHPDHGKFIESRYPIEWNEINGRILQKIQYENPGSFLLSMPRPNMKNYR